MENAAKALVIAGGVLIALVTIGVLVDSFSTTSQFQMSQLSQQEQEQLIAFNEQYTKYANQYVYGTDVITVANMSLNNNMKYDVTVNIKFTKAHKYKYNSMDYTIPVGTYTIRKNQSVDEHIKRFISGETDLNTMAFKCIKIEYNENNGRVNSITFEERSW